MRVFKVALTENITGIAEGGGLDQEHAERIALATLNDEGLGAFPDFVQTRREVEVDDGDMEQLRKNLEEEWVEDSE